MQLILKGADVKTYFLPSNLAAIRGLFNIYLTFIRKVLNRYAFHVIDLFPQDHHHSLKLPVPPVGTYRHVTFHAVRSQYNS